MSSFDHIVEVKSIIPPLPGGQKYAAKAVMYENGRRVQTLGERWGVTRAEAEKKANEDAKDWIRDRADPTKKL